MNIADAARFITEGVTMTVELSDNVDKKIDAIRGKKSKRWLTTLWTRLTEGGILHRYYWV
ncbi:MAG: hypothetical protein CM15mV57_660 [uncultured marine virus]|nr:MAG: hypothetical protein CM15mV57_660 [uncultured marine virus]